MSVKNSHQWRSVAVGIIALVAVVIIAIYAPAEGRSEAYSAISAIVSVVVMRHALSYAKEKDSTP